MTVCLNYRGLLETKLLIGSWKVGVQKLETISFVVVTSTVDIGWRFHVGHEKVWCFPLVYHGFVVLLAYRSVRRVAVSAFVKLWVHFDRYLRYFSGRNPIPTQCALLQPVAEWKPQDYSRVLAGNFVKMLQKSMTTVGLCYGGNAVTCNLETFWCFWCRFIGGNDCSCPQRSVCRSTVRWREHSVEFHTAELCLGLYDFLNTTANKICTGRLQTGSVFTARHYANAVYAVIVCLSACLFVRLSQVAVLRR